MNSRFLLILVLLAGIIISAGCLSNQGVPSPAPVSSHTQAPGVQPSITPEKVVPPEVTLTGTLPAAQAKESVQETGVPSSKIERASDMGSFISSSFPEVTKLYGEIKKSNNALEWKSVQDQSLKLQILIQDLKKTYQLNTPNPEKKIFPGLDSRQEIIFLKYVRYLDDMENYATNLKNAVYYQEKGSDPQSAQTSRRFQGLADQFEKQAIAEVKTIGDYCKDFKYTFFNLKIADQYRYTG